MRTPLSTLTLPAWAPRTVPRPPQASITGGAHGHIRCQERRVGRWPSASQAPWDMGAIRVSGEKVVVATEDSIWSGGAGSWL